jgi:hypothetical protein
LFWERSTDKKEGLVVDYAKLADKAKVIQEADKLAAAKHKQLRADPCVFFERVKAHLAEEMNKANVELRKREAAILDRNHLPGFADDVFITYGTSSVCRVGLGILGGGCRITAVISGPPNGCEISRRVYLCSQEPSCQEEVPTGEEGSQALPTRPNEIAADIISGILLGKFH